MEEQSQRFIEIGPSATLATMMKKTLAQAGNSIQGTHECLTFNDELEAFRKASEPEPESENEEEGGSSVEASQAEAVPVTASSAPLPLVAPVEQTAIQDSPPTAHEVVLAIVAVGLKTAKGNVDVAQSVKFLAKGMLIFGFRLEAPALD